MWVRRSLQAVHNRPARRIGALLVVVVLALITATSSSAPLPVAGRWPMFRLPSRSGIFGSGRPGRPSWKGVPQQADGSAVGRSHDVTSAATRAATAAGHPRGVGQGELPAYSPYARKFTPGPSVPAQRGFDRRPACATPGSRPRRRRTTTTPTARTRGSFPSARSTTATGRVTGRLSTPTCGVRPGVGGNEPAGPTCSSRRPPTTRTWSASTSTEHTASAMRCRVRRTLRGAPPARCSPFPTRCRIPICGCGRRRAAEENS
jgi:hypothetical protein